jgi:hypothetical protein
MSTDQQGSSRRPARGDRRALAPASLAVSILALVVATSSATAYAATKITTRYIKRGAVTSAKIRDGGVHGVDLGGGAVTGVKIADGSVGAADLAPSARAATVYGGSVDADGMVTRAFGGIASVERVNQLEYYEYVVTFQRDVSACLVTATGADHPAVAWHGDPLSQPRVVYVHNADESGTAGWPAAPFSVAVICHPT